MFDSLVLLAADTMASRIIVCLVAVVFGVVFILIGRHNIRTKKAEESGSRRGVNKLLGRSNTYEGKSAVAMGQLRILCGVAAIIFGIVFLFVGPFLADK